jgi:hypothetical protein
LIHLTREEYRGIRSNLVKGKVGQISYKMGLEDGVSYYKEGKYNTVFCVISTAI